MATTFEERLKAAREGTYDQLASPLAEEPEESFDDTTLAPELRPPAPYEEDSDIIVHNLEEQERVQDGPTARDKWLGYTAATTFELGTILTTSLWLNRIRQARTAMKVNPASWTTPAGWAGLVGGEMVIGGLANWQAQEIKKAYKLQDAVYMSEVYAAALFNATPITTMVDNRKIFQFVQPALGKRFGAKEIIINGVKSTASGAALGLLESTFRQTVGLMMNERENFDQYDAYASAGIGGTLNTALKGGGSLLNFWRQSGRWGRKQAITVVERMDDTLKKEEEQIKDQIKKTEEELPKEVKFGFGGGIAVATKNQSKADLAKKLRAVQEAIELNKQSAIEIKAANAKVDEAEANPKPIEEPKPLTEAELEAVDKKVVEEPEVKPAEVEEPEAPKAVEKPEEAVEAEVPAPEPKPVEKPKEVELPENEKQLQSLHARIKEAFSTGVPPTTSSPEIAREAGQLVRNTLGTFNRAIKTFRDSGNKETRALEIALDEVVFLRRLNKKVMDPLDTMHARGTQAKKRDSAKYDYSDELSNRAIEEDEAWSRVEGSLRHAIEKAEDGDLSKNIKDALEIRPRFKELGKQFDRKATADYKRKLREAAGKEPKEVPQEVIVAKLRDKLKEAQQEFAGLKPEAKAKKAREKSEQEIDIQKRLDFYATGKKEAKQIAQEENRFETYSELLEEGDLAEIRKQVGPAPDWNNKKEVTSYLSTIRKVNNKTKKLLEKQVIESDISLQDPNKVAKAEAKKKAQLEKRLKELQKRFGDINKIRPKDKPKKAEADAEIEDLKNRIKFHEANERDALKLEAAYKERARLLKVETGPLGVQRAEVTKPKGPTKVPGELEKVNKDIAFLKSNMRKRVDEIDRARLEMDEAYQEAQMLEALRKKRAKLKDRLEARRQRAFDDEDLDKRAYEAAGRKFEETDPISLEYQDKIKFYDKIEAEALKKKQLREQLARQAEMEGRGVVSEIRAHITPKPTGPKPVSSNDELRRQIRQSDSRMRAFIKDLDEAQDAMRDERIYEDVSKAIIESAKYDVNSRVVSILRAWANARVMAMIYQTSSVFASFLGGVTSTFKQIVKPFTEFAADVIVTRGYKASDISALQTMKANFWGLKEGFSNWKGTGRAVMRTAKDLESATGGAGRNKFTRERGFNEDPVKLYELAQKQARDKRLRGEGVRKGGVASILAHLPVGRMFTEVYKLPLRGIMPIDEMFRRQLSRAEIMSEQWKIAYDTYPNDPTKAAEYAAQLYDSKWTKDNGIDVLSDEGINTTATDTINKELLFDSNVAELDHREIARPFADLVLDMAKKIRQNKDNPASGALMHLLMPIVTVVARGAGRTTRVSLPFIPATQAAANPYNRKINYFERIIDKNRKHIEHPDQTPERRARLVKANEEYEQKIRELKGRRIAYHRDAITDTLWGSGMMAAGYITALMGLSVGTLSWMTKEQREKFTHKNPKAKPNSILGWQYKEFLPISGPFAIGADLAMVDMLKEEEDDTGKPLLQKNQTSFNVALRSLVEMGKEVPVAGGLKSAERVLSGDDDMMKGVLSDWGASFGLVPAQMRKLLEIYFGDGDIDELKGGTIEDRMLYRMIGYNKTGNKKVDHFGEDMPSQKNLLQAFFRFAPDTELERTAFDDIYSKDIEGRGQLKDKPTSFGSDTGIDMYKFVDNTGMSLHYRFALELRKTGVKDTVNNLIQQSWWKELYEEGSRKRDRSADPLSVSNEAIAILNETLGEAYNETVYRIIDNKDNQDGTVWLDEFLHTSDKNKEGTPEYEKYGPSVTLRQKVDMTEERADFSTGSPKSFKDIFEDYDLDELLDANPQMQLSD